jgi:transcriptional regulator with XRE-family HTH domain
MHENREPDVLALAIVVLRASRGWTQAELAAAAGTSASVVSEYESGKRRPTRKVVERFAAATDIFPEDVDYLLPALQTILTSRSKDIATLSPEETGAQLAQKVEILIRSALEELIRRPKEPRKEDPPNPEDRVKARLSWAQLQRLSWKNRRILVDEGRAFQNWALCELLCEESFQAASRGDAEAEDLADLALRVARKISGEPAWLSRLLGYAWAHVAHARRIKGDPEGTREAFSRVQLLWEDGFPDPEWLDAGRVREIQAQASADLLPSPWTLS